LWVKSLNLLFLFTPLLSTLTRSLLLVNKMIFTLFNFNDDAKSMYEDYSMKNLSTVHENLTKKVPLVNQFKAKYLIKKEV